MKSLKVDYENRSFYAFQGSEEVITVWHQYHLVQMFLIFVLRVHFLESPINLLLFSSKSFYMILYDYALYIAKRYSFCFKYSFLLQRVMGQKFMLVALLSGIQWAKILLKLTIYQQILLLTNVSVLFLACPVSVPSEVHLRNYFYFAFPQMAVGVCPLEIKSWLCFSPFKLDIDAISTII